MDHDIKHLVVENFTTQIGVFKDFIRDNFERLKLIYISLLSNSCSIKGIDFHCAKLFV